MKYPTSSVRLAGTALAAACAAFPATLSYSGAFGTDDETAVIAFDVVTPGPVSFRTFSYAGGTNGAGTLIPAGGFDPYLSLFAFSGLQLLLAVNEDRAGICGTDNPADPVTGTCFDAGLDLTLAAGRYLAVVSQSGNPPVGPTFADGFLMAGTGNYTGGPFLDVLGNQRTGDWALDITGEVAEEVPEPAPALAVPLAGLLFLAISRRRA